MLKCHIVGNHMSWLKLFENYIGLKWVNQMNHFIRIDTNTVFDRSVHALKSVWTYNVQSISCTLVHLSASI